MSTRIGTSGRCDATAWSAECDLADESVDDTLNVRAYPVVDELHRLFVEVASPNGSLLDDDGGVDRAKDGTEGGQRSDTGPLLTADGD